MATRDLVHRLHVAQALAPVAEAASKTGISIDTQGYESVMFAVEIGVVTDGTHTPKLQDSPDASVWTDVVAGNLLDSGFAAVTSTGGGSAVQFAGYIGSQRYVRVATTVSGATTGAVVSATAILGNARTLAAE